MKKSVLDWIVCILAIIAGLNWLSVALFSYEFVYATFGNIVDILPRIILILLGLATLYSVKHICKKK